jgi:hypothetical protein
MIPIDRKGRGTHSYHKVNIAIPETGLGIFPDCLRIATGRRSHHEFFPALSPVQDAARPESVGSDHLSRLPELSELSGTGRP